MESGASFLTALLVKYTLQHEYMLALELWDSFSLITLPKMGVESPFSARFTLMEVSNFWVYPMST